MGGLGRKGGGGAVAIAAGGLIGHGVPVGDVVGDIVGDEVCRGLCVILGGGGSRRRCLGRCRPSGLGRIVGRGGCAFILGARYCVDLGLGDSGNIVEDASTRRRDCGSLQTHDLAKIGAAGTVSDTFCRSSRDDTYAARYVAQNSLG